MNNSNKQFSGNTQNKKSFLLEIFSYILLVILLIVMVRYFMGTFNFNEYARTAEQAAEKENYEEALESINKALEIKPLNKTALDQKSLILMAMGDRNALLDHFYYYINNDKFFGGHRFMTLNTNSDINTISVDSHSLADLDNYSLIEHNPFGILFNSFVNLNMITGFDLYQTNIQEAEDYYDDIDITETIENFRTFYDKTNKIRYESVRVEKTDDGDSEEFNYLIERTPESINIGASNLNSPIPIEMDLEYTNIILPILVSGEDMKVYENDEVYLIESNINYLDYYEALPLIDLDRLELLREENPNPKIVMAFDKSNYLPVAYYIDLTDLYYWINKDILRSSVFGSFNNYTTKKDNPF